MTVGAFTHDGQIQTIDDSKREFRTDRGVEFNFRDSWMFNVAAYKIDRLIGLNLVPPSVARTYKGTRGAFTWWIDDIKMDEADRFKEKLTPPDLDKWNQQMQLVRLFDQLIANVDRNLTNLLIGNDWNVWAIDHTRAFRTKHEPEDTGQHRALRSTGLRQAEATRQDLDQGSRGRATPDLRDRCPPQAPRPDRRHHRTEGRGRAV